MTQSLCLFLALFLGFVIADVSCAGDNECAPGNSYKGWDFEEDEESKQGGEKEFDIPEGR